MIGILATATNEFLTTRGSGTSYLGAAARTVAVVLACRVLGAAVCLTSNVAVAVLSCERGCRVVAGGALGAFA
jgi:hypothetical protein